MTSNAPSPHVHVDGTSVTVASGAVPGRYPIWADPLYGGPVRGGSSDAGRLDMHMRHLLGTDRAQDKWGVEEPAPDAVNDMRPWRDVIARMLPRKI